MTGIHSPALVWAVSFFPDAWLLSIRTSHCHTVVISISAVQPRDRRRVDNTSVCGRPKQTVGRRSVSALGRQDPPASAIPRPSKTLGRTTRFSSETRKAEKQTTHPPFEEWPAADPRRNLSKVQASEDSPQFSEWHGVQMHVGRVLKNNSVKHCVRTMPHFRW